MRALRLAAALTLVAAAGVWSAGSASADASYDGQAKADGVDITFYNPSLPLGLTVEGAGPTASSHLNTVGVSDAFAAFPYPGDTVAGLPGLAGALFGNLPTPSYPFIVTTQLGDEPKDQDLGPITLHAESGVEENAAQGTVGTGTTGDQSTSRVEQLSDGSVRATADTSINLLKLADQLTVSGVQAHVEVDADASTGSVTRSSSLSFGRIQVPGLALTLPPTTPGSVPIPQPVGALPQLPPVTGLPELPVPFGGTTLEEPDIGFENGQFTVTVPGGGGTKTFAVPAQPVLDAFKAAGVTITYQAAQNTDTGIQGATLTLATTLPAPPNNELYSGPSQVGYVLGRSNANVDLQPDLSSYSDPNLGVSATGTSPAATPTLSPAPAGTSAGTTGVPGSSATAGGSTGSAGAGGSTVTSAGNAAPSATSGSVDAGVVPPVMAAVAPVASVASGTLASGTQSAAPVGTSLRALSHRADDIYLLFVFVAVLAFIAATGLRILGVRLLWRS